MNGWQRAWLVLTVMLGAIWTLFFVLLGDFGWENVKGILILTAVPAAAIYALGWGIAWVRRGFRADRGARR
jgi:hypothetical protein